MSRPARRQRGAAVAERAASDFANDLAERIEKDGLGPLLAPMDVARLAGVNRSTVFGWFSSGLPRVRVGRVVRVPAKALCDWLSRRVLVG